jgi:solute carrier family 25 carnitine/acylcarnitine transporter 20/29
MPQHDDETPNIKKIPNRPKDLTEVSRTVLRSEQAKRWTKKYRTEVAASSSSLLSTFVAVCEDCLGSMKVEGER